MREWLNSCWRGFWIMLAVVVPIIAWGQDAQPVAAGEGTAEVAAPEEAASAPQRSELWLAVQAQGNPDADAAARKPWHLSDDQREQLREQVRRGLDAPGQEPVASSEGEPAKP